MTTEHLNTPVCRHCGSEELRSIERAISWRSVDFVPDPEHGWITGDDWGDDEGDPEAASVGIVCSDCYAEVATPGYEPSGTFDARELVTTRAAWNRRPVVTYRVTLRYAQHDDPENKYAVTGWAEHPRAVIGRGRTELLAGRDAIARMAARQKAGAAPRLFPRFYYQVAAIRPAA